MPKRIFLLAVLLLFGTCLDGHITTIISDLGGVILTSGHLEFDDDTCPPKNSIKAVAWSDWMRGLITKQELIDRTSQFFDRACVTKLVNEALSPERPMIQETVDLLLKLKNEGYKLFLLSNLSADAHAVLVKTNPFFALFDGMVFSFQEGLIKPELSIYQVVLNRFGLTPDTCLFIDDKLVNIEAAQRLGIKGIAFKPGELEASIKKHLDP